MRTVFAQVATAREQSAASVPWMQKPLLGPAAQASGQAREEQCLMRVKLIHAAPTLFSPRRSPSLSGVGRNGCTLALIAYPQLAQPSERLFSFCSWRYC